MKEILQKSLPSLFLVFILFLSFMKIGDAATRKRIVDPVRERAKREMQIVQKKFYDTENSKKFIAELKEQVLKLGGKSVPILTRVMKDKKVSDQKRWMATFSLGRIMGKKSADYLAKFTKHPNWVLRLASLKTLLSLQDKSKGAFYEAALKDDSLMVRTQALENIRSLKLDQHAESVWKMLFHKHNYVGEKGDRKRLPIISKVIRTIGDLKHAPAKKLLVKLISSKKYRDLSLDLDYSLRKITGKVSPSSYDKKVSFWQSAKI